MYHQVIRFIRMVGKYYGFMADVIFFSFKAWLTGWEGIIAKIYFILYPFVLLFDWMGGVVGKVKGFGMSMIDAGK